MKNTQLNLVSCAFLNIFRLCILKCKDSTLLTCFFCSSLMERQSTLLYTINSDLTSVSPSSFLSISHRPLLSGWTGFWRLRKCTAKHEGTLELSELLLALGFVMGFMWYFILSQVKASHFDGLITTILGYILLAGALMVCHVSSAVVIIHNLSHSFCP